MLLKHITAPLLAAVAGLVILAPPAIADNLIAAAAGARNLDQAAGYMVWAEPDGTRWRLVVRAPGGSVSRPDIATFGAAPDATVAATRVDRPFAVAPYAVYSRCAGTSLLSGCDVHRLDLRTGLEREVDVAATDRYSETAPGADQNTLTFVRRGRVPPSRKGVHYVYLGSNRPVALRVSPTLARDTKTNVSRVAYSGRRTVVVRLLSRPSRSAILFGGQDAPRSLIIDRYRVGWIDAGEQVFRSGRFGGSGPATTEELETGNRRLPDDTDGIAPFSGKIRLYLNGEGVNRVEPRLFQIE